MNIQGPNGLGNAVDTYPQPSIVELKEFYEISIYTYDASTKKNSKCVCYLTCFTLMWR